MQYMIGSENADCGGVGDPAMVYTSPTEQFLPRYVVLVPDTWINDALIVTRVAGSEVLLDDVAIPDAQFIDVAGSGFEVARVIVADGIHTLRMSGDGCLIAFYAGGVVEGLEVSNLEMPPYETETHSEASGPTCNFYCYVLRIRSPGHYTLEVVPEPDY